MGPGCDPPRDLYVHERVLSFQAVAADQLVADVCHRCCIHTPDTDRRQAVGQPAHMPFHLECDTTVHPNDFVDPVREQESTIVR